MLCIVYQDVYLIFDKISQKYTSNIYLYLTIFLKYCKKIVILLLDIRQKNFIKGYSNVFTTLHMTLP